MAATNKVLLIGYGFQGEPGLESLIEQGSFDVLSVVTPPYEIGRYRPVRPLELPVERLAEEYKIPITRTNTESDIQELVDRYKPESVLICVYNKIFSREILESGPSFYNIHHGDVPKWRGSSSSEWAVISGRNEITLTLHEVIPNLDSGDIFWQDRITITDEEDLRDMRRKMNDIIRRNLGLVYAHILHPEDWPQVRNSHDVYRREQKGKSSYTCSIREEDALIDWNKSAGEIYNLIRGLCDPVWGVPPAYTFYEGEKLTILSSEIIKNPRSYVNEVVMGEWRIKYNCGIPGKPVQICKGEGVEVLTGDGTLLIKDVEYGGWGGNASEVLRSIRNTLGLHPKDLFEKISKLEARVIELSDRLDKPS